MGAKVRWVKSRAAWFIYVYANGTEKAKRLGPRDSDRRRGERLAKEVVVSLASRSHKESQCPSTSLPRGG